MDPLTDRLLRLLQARHGWRRGLLLIQEASGRVSWVKLPDDLELALRLSTDDTVSLTLGHRDPGEAFLAELESGAPRTGSASAAGQETTPGKPQQVTWNSPTLGLRVRL